MISVGFTATPKRRLRPHRRETHDYALAMASGDDLFDGPGPSGGCAGAAVLLLLVLTGLLLSMWWYLTAGGTKGDSAPVIPPVFTVHDSELLGCGYGSDADADIYHWNGAEFQTIHAPEPAQVDSCRRSVEQRAAEHKIDRAVVNRETVVSGGPYPAVSPPDRGYSATFFDSAPNGEAVISFCRTETQNPDHHCYLEISARNADRWTRLPGFSAGVELISPTGVLMKTPSTPNADVVYQLYDFDGTLVTTIDDAHPNARFQILDDRVVAVARPDGRSVSVEQYLFSD